MGMKKLILAALMVCAVYPAWAQSLSNEELNEILKQIDQEAEERYDDLSSKGLFDRAKKWSCKTTYFTTCFSVGSPTPQCAVKREAKAFRITERYYSSVSSGGKKNRFPVLFVGYEPGATRSLIVVSLKGSSYFTLDIANNGSDLRKYFSGGAGSGVFWGHCFPS
jgi:hypothetical protein